MKADEKALSQIAPWPFAVDKSRHELDINVIESHAVDIIARAIVSKRLMVFAGAGLTMAYGRMTWSQLLDRMFVHVSTAAGRIESQFPFDDEMDRVRSGPRHAYEAMARVLWPNGIEEFRNEKGNYVVTAQLFADAMGEIEDITPKPSNAKKPRPSNFQKWVASLLQDYKGRLHDLVPGKQDGNESPDSGKTRTLIERKRPGFATYVNALLGDVSDSKLLDIYKSTYLSLLSFKDSPLDILINLYGAKRFLTTNYDREIEKALDAFDYPNWEERLGNAGLAGHETWHRSLKLTPSSTGEAIGFAVEGGRRHAQVMHMHGICEEPQDLIITEADYQRLYLEERDTRDLLENGVRALFGANPILFVGSNVEEDDIMRPLRQFATGTPHRRDRMAVALLPCRKGDDKAAMQKLTLYVRYGIHAIHFGSIKQPGSDTNVNILERVDTFCTLIEKVCDGVGVSDDLMKSLEKANEKLAKLSSVFESQHDPNGLVAQLGELYVHLEPLYAEVIKIQARRVSGAEQVDVRRVRRLRFASEEIRTAFTTLLMCNTLVTIHQEALRRTELARKLPNTWRRPSDDDVSRYIEEKSVTVFVRHAVALCINGEKSWFADPSANGPLILEPTKALERICEGISKQNQFIKNGTRRVLVISAPRGAGKGALFDSLRYSAPLKRLCNTLRFYDVLDSNAPHPLVFHFNLTFCNDIGPIMTQLSDTILRICAPAEAELPPTRPPVAQDQIELLALALDALMRPESPRCLLLLGNAGVLFDEHGEAKNGQIRRVFQLLGSTAFRRAQLDIVMFCSEQQVPSAFRRQNRRREADQRIYSREVAIEETGADWDKVTIRARSMSRMVSRRHDRLNLSPPASSKKRMLLLGLEHLSAKTLWTSFFSTGLTAEPNEQQQIEDVLITVYRATGANRMAMTLVFAYVRLGMSTCISDELRSIVRELQGCAVEVAVERTTAVVLDRWFQRHLRGEKWALPETALHAAGEHPKAKALCVELWNLSTEIMWTLSVLSQPVEVRTLEGCALVIIAATNVFQKDNPNSRPSVEQLRAIILDALETLVRWCLLFRIEKRPRYKTDPGGRLDDTFYRYSTHRQIQRHFLRLSGGRNVETTRWDQFTTTLYASQPDELPTLPRLMHRKLVDLVRGLTLYPMKYETPSYPHTPTQRDRLRERLRAAYGLISSSFSLGIVCRSTDALSPNIPPKEVDGTLEEYRLLVRWILRQAVELDDDMCPPPVQAKMVGPEKALRDVSNVQLLGHGVFYPGELLWLYSECGVIALAQGKLDQAEEHLAMAELAARKIENDDTGSIHVRVRLNMALAQIERGRPIRARSMLLPISERRGGHPVPLNVAKFYLGLIEHLGGNYRAADAYYVAASIGLREVGRSRALAFVLRSQSDLHYALHPHDVEGALSIANEAISLAQHGGHEDLRVIASLARVRMLVKAKQDKDVFEHLASAERYANRMDIPRVACEVHELRARHLFQQGETALSAKEASASLEVAGLYDLKLMKARAMLTLARIYLARGQHSDAMQLVGMGKELATASDYFSCVRGFGDLEMELASELRRTC